MGKEKAGFLTPKAIANRIKSKGLQKLRWYCQMCNKQCRDENGFKCHTLSEAHQRQLLLFAENPNKYMSTFSHDFLKGYLDIVRRQFGGKRVHCNVVYQEYIKQKDHIHMNSTRWHTLTGLVNWLGKVGICKIDQTEKGWFLEYIEKDPVKMRQQEADARLKLTEEMLTQKQINRQIERDRARLSTSGGEDGSSLEGGSSSEVHELIRDPEEGLIRLKLFASSTTENTNDSEDKNAMPPPPPPPASLIKKNVLLEASRRELLKSDRMSTCSSSSSNSLKRKSSSSTSSSSQPACFTALDEIKLEEERRKEQENRRDYWLHEGIVVKLTSRSFEQHGLRGQKAIVRKMIDDYTAMVELIQSSSSSTPQIKVDQSHVETVIPAVGRRVLIVNGAYRDCQATLLKIKVDEFACDVQIETGLCRGRVTSVKYEDLCKLHQD